MSIIQQIREKYAAIGIGFIALSLVGFILMDSAKSGGSGGIDPTDAIGEINGTSISYNKFVERTASIEDMQRMNGRNVDEDLRQQINTEFWRQMVENVLLEDEYEKLGIKVTKKEFNDLLFGANPPEFLTQQFTNPETGQYDGNAARQAILDMKKAGNNPNTAVIEEFYLQPLVENTKRQKYDALLQNSRYAPKFLAEKTLTDNSAIASFSYVSIPYSSIADSTAVVSDAMVKSYVDSRKREFKQEDNLRSISYVAFPFNPSASDSTEVLAEIEALKNEFVATEDPGGFVTRNASTINFADIYISKERIQIPQKDSIIGSGVGNVYGPYIDGNSFVISKVVDSKIQPDSVKARHILISMMDMNTQQPIMSDSAAKAKIDSLERIIKGGASFATVATENSNDQGSAAKGGDLGYFASGMMVPEFNDYSFNNPKGSMGIVKTQFGYHLIEITDQKNFVPAYKIAYLARSIDASMETVNAALNAANQFAGNARNVKAFDDAVIKQNLNKLVVPEVRENDYVLMGLGNNRRLVKDVFEASVGDVLDPVELADQYIVVAITGEEKSGVMSVAKARPMVESILRNQVKAKMIIEKMGKITGLQELATANNTIVQSADSVSFVSPVISGVGFEPRLGGFAFYKGNLNKVSAPIGGNTGVFVLQTKSVGATQNMGSSLEDTRNTLINQARGSASSGSMQALRERGKVKDYRSKFF